MSFVLSTYLFAFLKSLFNLCSIQKRYSNTPESQPTIKIFQILIFNHALRVISPTGTSSLEMRMLTSHSLQARHLLLGNQLLQLKRTDQCFIPSQPYYPNFSLNDSTFAFISASNLWLLSLTVKRLTSCFFSVRAQQAKKNGFKPSNFKTF